MIYRTSAKELQTQKEEVFSLSDAIALIKEENEKYNDQRIPTLLKEAENALRMFSKELEHELTNRIKEQARDASVFESAAFRISESFHAHVKELIQTPKGHELFLELLSKKFPGFLLYAKYMGRDLWLTFRNPNANA